MKEWHVKNMEKTILKYAKGLSPDANRFERRMYKQYGGINKVQIRIQYDIKHGASIEDVISFLQRVKTETEFSDLRNHEGFLDRLKEIESYFI